MQNSWGVWGDGGYFRMAMMPDGTPGTCGMYTYMVAPGDVDASVRIAEGPLPAGSPPLEYSPSPSPYYDNNYYYSPSPSPGFGSPSSSPDGSSSPSPGFDSPSPSPDGSSSPSPGFDSPSPSPDDSPSPSADLDSPSPEQSPAYNDIFNESPSF